VALSKNIETVIFDCDGVLADTMPLHCAAYQQAFAEVGLHLEPDLFYKNSAGTAKETLEKLLAGQDYQGEWQQLHKRKKEIVLDLIDSDQLKPLAASQLVPLLSESYRLAVASSGSSVSVHRIVNRLGLSNYFEEIITGEDVKNGKPNPEPYLLVASRLGVEPSKCLVFEDSKDGLEAARRAEMKTISVYSFVPYM